MSTAVFDDAATIDTLITGSRLFLSYEVALFITAVLAISIVRSVTERQAGLVNLVADRTPVPTRPDLPDGAVDQNL